MAFWIFLYLCTLLCPGLMLLLGWWMRRHPPKDINCVLGYRTSRSMQNQDTWDFAQVHAGSLWWKLGWWVLIPSAVLPFLYLQADADTVAGWSVVLLFLQCAILLLSLIPTEIALKKTFTADGIRR